MKKVLALVLALVLVMGLSVTAFAVGSPGADVVHTITFINGTNAQKVSTSVGDSDTYKLTVDTTKGTFDKWVIYKTDGTLAKEGTDYTFTSGNATSPDAVIKLLTDVTICGNYNGKITDPVTGAEKTDVSDKTGDFTVLYLALVMMAAAACGFASKKQLSK